MLKSLVALITIVFILSSTDFLETLAERLSMTGQERSREDAPHQNFKSNGAYIGVCFIFVVIGGIHLPNTLMSRPHVVFWRAIQACFIMYAMFMTYLLLLPVD